jgi:TonB-linked SusC/RagA family outer membrane protein
MRRLLLLLLGTLLMTVQLLAQNRTISGTVTDNIGKGIPGATVKVSGSKIGTITDERGSFTLSVPQNARSLEFSSVGFVAQTVTIPAVGGITLSLKPDATSMNEVVVTGLTRTARSKYAGAATKIDERSIGDRPVGSFDQIFQGRVPGVLSLTSSGAPGTSANIIIRGVGSLQGGTSPLYVIDGIPVEAGVFQSLNPNDFESIDILRDAAGTAIYGSRGSAGVILVTTKRGTSNKMKVSYGAQFGQKSRPEFTWDMMTAAQLLKTQEQYGLALGITGSAASTPGWFYSPSNPINASLTQAQKDRNAVILDSMSKINTDWRDVFFRDGSFSNHQVSVSGGAGRTRIYSSLALYNEQGITYRTDMKRGTWRNNIDYADDKLTFSVSSNLGYTKRNFQQSTTTNSTGNPFLVANITPGYAKLFLNKDTIATGTGNKFAGANAYELTNLDKNYSNQAKATLSLTSAYKITNDITAGITAGIDFRETQASNYGSKLAYTRVTSTTPTGQAGFQSESLTRFFQADIRPSLAYRKLFNDKHDIDVAIYGEYIKYADKTMNYTGFGIDPRTPNTPAAITQGNAVNLLFATVGGAKNQSDLVSGFATARYTYNGKYTLTGSYRKDGSSKLPVATRWQGFYSVGAVWEATKEDFMKNNRILNTLRVKASYGGSGNADNFPGGSYPYQPAYVASGNYSGLPTEFASYPGNPALKWETTWVANLGIDYGFWGGRIWGDINLYDKRTKDLFVQKTLSATSGFGLLNINAGELQNKGIEVTANFDVIRKKDVVVNVFGNFAYNHNEILSLGGESSYEQGTGKIAVGMPAGAHYEIKWGGVDAATGAPLYYDANGNLTNNYSLGKAVQEFGTWEAPWKGGFGGSIRYKAFELSTLFSWEKGANKYDNLAYFMQNPNGFLGVGFNQASTLKFWQKPGEIVETPSPLYNVNFSSQFIHKADFLRWKDIMVSYIMPKSLTEKLKFVSSARFFVQGTNLMIWTPWRGMDPEAGAVNINLSEFPNPRAITAGFDITF